MKPALQAVPAAPAEPTALDRYHEARAERDAIRAEAEQLTQRIPKLPDHAGALRAAQAALSRITATHAERMATWARAGAEGEPPQMDMRARDAAAREVESMGAQAQATGEAAAAIGRQIAALHERLQAAQRVLDSAKAAVIGERLLDLQQGARDADQRLNRVNAEYAAAYQRALALDAQITGRVAARVREQALAWANTPTTAHADGAADFIAWAKQAFGE